MRRQVISVLIWVATSSLASGQGASFGIKAGLNLAKLSTSLSATGLSSQNDTPDTYVSFSAGVFGVIKLGDKFGFQPELLYSGQGGDLGVGSFRLNYLNLPVMFRFSPTPEFSLQAGPQLGILLSAEISGIDIKDQFNTTDFGFGFGLGYEFPIKVDIGFRYVVGLLNIFNADVSSSGLPSLTMTMNNQVLQFSVGHRF